MSTLLTLPGSLSLTAEMCRLRAEGVHVHCVCLDAEAAEDERQARIAGLARLPSSRARRWYWQACAIADWYEGKYEMSEQMLRRDPDRAGEFPRWPDFERETIRQPLAELHAHADFHVRHQVRRCRGKIVSVCFQLASAREGQ